MDPLAPAGLATGSLDLARLSQQQTRALAGSGGKAADAAQGFEAMLLTQLIKGLRKTVPESPDSTAMGQMYQEMFDEQLAQEVARRGGIGIAKILESYLARTDGTPRPDAASTAAARTAGPTTDAPGTYRP